MEDAKMIEKNNT